jgi:hypothetical protein
MNKDEFLKVLATATNEEQTAFYNGCLERGLTEKDVETIKMQVTFYKMQDKAFYNLVRETVGAMLNA